VTNPGNLLRDHRQHAERCLTLPAPTPNIDEAIMPVVGHAFVGLATAVQFEPASRRDGGTLSPLTVVCWAPVVVAVSYFPDLVKQLGSSLGWPLAGVFGHSLVVAFAGGALFAACWARVSAISPKLLLGLSIGSILGHDFLDLLQSTDRAPFWPWSTRIITSGTPWLPTHLMSETVLFAALFAAFAAWRVATGRTLGSLTAPPQVPRAWLWSIRGAAAALIAAALAVHAFRARLEHQLDAAERFVQRGQYAEALALADRIDGAWLAATKPGRVDIVRAQVSEALGDSARAEALYRRAFDEDPTNFWAAVDIAEYYANSDRPLDERRRLVQPYLAALRTRFVSYRELPAILDRIDRRLALNE
jgi:hypothetical protein